MSDKSLVVWRDGSWKEVETNSAWEYQNDADWLVTIPLKQDAESFLKRFSEEISK